MKARVPVLSAKRKQEAVKELEREYEKVRDKERQDMTRRIIKVILYVLHERFGFGVHRLAKAFDGFNEMFDESDRDEIFWEHVDRVVIDKLGIQFERDYTENGKVISESDYDNKHNSTNRR